MPLPEDPKVVETSTGLVKVLQDIFGSHPGYRPGMFLLDTLSSALSGVSFILPLSLSLPHTRASLRRLMRCWSG